MKNNLSRRNLLKTIGLATGAALTTPLQGFDPLPRAEGRGLILKGK
jgi:hypothetical protein